MALDTLLDQCFLDEAARAGQDRWLLLQTAYTGPSRRTALDTLPVTAASRVADLGCGFGAAVLEIADRFGAEVHGFDLAEHRLATAREISGRLPTVAGRVHFATADVTRDVPPEPYDIVTARFVLQYLPAVATLKHWAKWLKPGGVLYLEEVDDGWTVDYPPPPPAWQRVIDAYRQASRAAGSDREIGRKLSHLLIEANYQLQHLAWNSQAALQIERIGDPAVSFERERLEAASADLIASGYLTADQLAEGIRQFQAAYPRLGFVSNATIRILATQRPG